MRVLIINKDLRLGGGTTVINDLEHGLKKFSIDMDIAIFENNIELTSINKGKVIVLSKQKKIAKILRPIYFFACFFKLMFIVPRYDLIFTFERYPSYFNIILSKLFNKKSIVYVINPLMTSLKNINKNKLLLNLHIYLHKVVFSLTNIVVVLEKNAKRELINYWLVKNEKIMIIPNFVDFKKIKFLSKSKINIREKEKILKNKVIINVGRLHSQKNHSLLIRAFHLVKKRFKKVILLIIGSGQEKNTLKELVKKLGLNDSVFILENEDNPFKYLALSDVFVLSSRFEGFGIVLLESLFFGLPIVSTDCSYSIKHIIAPELSIDKLPNIYMNDYGTIISEKSEQTTKLMADRIKYYLNNKISNSIKVKKIKRALGFSKDKILPMWVKILNGLFT